MKQHLITALIALAVVFIVNNVPQVGDLVAKKG